MFGHFTTLCMRGLNDQKRKMLEFLTEEKDLGVITDHKLNFSSYTVTHANKMMGLIRRCYTPLDRTSFQSGISSKKMKIL